MKELFENFRAKLNPEILQTNDIELMILRSR